MHATDFTALVSRHRNYFRTGATRSVEWRERQLTALRAMMTDRAEDFYASLWTDLRRNRTDADLTDVKYLIGEVDHALAHLRNWMKPAPVSTPSTLAPSDAIVRFDPLGVGLIIGTWNYPVMLTLSPLLAAISGGNAAGPFLGHLKETLLQFYGGDSQKSPDYGRIINIRHFDRLTALLASGTVYHGGRHDRADRFIAPTVLVNVSPDSPVMLEEIFGPILPVLEVDNVEQAIEFVNARPSPLGLYVFAEDQRVTEQTLDRTTSGDAAVNDCTIHPLIHGLPFGGVGNSGMGKYHGEWGFRAYTNARGVLCHGTQMDPDVRYPPYSRNGTSRPTQPTGG